MYVWTCLLLAQGLFGFETFHICFSSFVLLHSDAKANLKLNHDVNDGFGMSCFEPSHFTKSKCDSGKIVQRCPLRGHTLFSPDYHLFDLFTAVSVYSLGNSLEIGAAALDSGHRVM